MTSDRLDSLTIDCRKITEYLLNEHSPAGAGKCKFFNGFGFLPEEWQRLHDALIRHPVTADLVDRQPSPYGEKQIYRCSIRSPDNRDPCILTVWQFRNGGWNFVTAYPWSQG